MDKTHGSELLESMCQFYSVTDPWKVSDKDFFKFLNRWKEQRRINSKTNQDLGITITVKITNSSNFYSATG